ncbi:hypothetical protein [Halomonas sp. 11-S5]|uniref:hypothetical protein n=1 Tax=Halomonas sp. 11-S5 TaxID=2994064 RepID=UPI0024699A89|nr:hypothetical protein [Halomonas sp. 11-S5]
MKVLKPWQAVGITVAVSFLLVLWEVPASTWATSATLSLAAGAAALALMATSAILAGRWGWVELVPVPAGPNSAAFRERLAEIAREVPADSVEIRFCGPQGLKDAVSQQMEELGIPRHNLAYEYFDFR